MYKALYRKYRPNNFDQVVGQDYVTKTLKNAIKNNKISHAYMLFGPRGIGKTTIAKIFARTVNCENPVDGNPCEKCSSCLKSKEISTVDIIEIDAASNNGVDEIREIKNKVNIVPSDLKYKVYIIDEVHMLTSGAFNALLKTLEEPPKHAIFVLATTDPQKVSETIISRCQCYSLKRISVDNIILKLKEVCQKEKIDIEEKVLKQIAISSNGGLRDALSSLDKLASYKQELITIDDYLEINDLISEIEINNLTECILNADIKNFILKINDYYNNGKNLIEIINQLMFYLKDIIVDYYVNNKEILYDIYEYQSLINLLNEKMFDIKKSANPKIYIELTLLEYMNNLIKENRNSSNYIEKSSEIISREIKIDSASTQKNISQEINPTEKEENNVQNEVKIDADLSNKSNIKQIMKIRLNNALAKGNKKEKQQCEEMFKKLNDYVFDQDIGYLVSELLNSKIQVVSDEIIIISYEYDSVVEQNLKELNKLTEILQKYVDINKKIGIITDKDWEQEKQKYIKTIKNNQKYDIIEEPELIECPEENETYEEVNNLADFGDILEIK